MRRRSSMLGQRKNERYGSCSSCGSRTIRTPFASTVYCNACRSKAETHHDPIRYVKGWLRGVFSVSDFGSGSFGSFHGSRQQAWPASFPSNRARRRAVLVGVSYASKQYELKGTQNDVNYMRYFLTHNFQFSNDSILLLTEEEGDPARIPTKENIRAAMRWLVWGNQPGDSLVFHFSGHGSQKLDLSGDEVDGFAETLFPVDYEETGVLIDDEMNATLVRPLRAGVTLHAIVDACHSGTSLDLPYLCRMSRGGLFQWEDHTPKSGVFKGTSGGLAICISGCDDSQSAQDTQAPYGSAITGAMTYSLIYTVENDPKITYGRLISSMRSVISGVGANVGFSGPVSSFVKRLLSHGIKQEPQLSASEMFDIYGKFFLL